MMFIDYSRVSLMARWQPKDGHYIYDLPRIHRQDRPGPRDLPKFMCTDFGIPNTLTRHELPSLDHGLAFPLGWCEEQDPAVCQVHWGAAHPLGGRELHRRLGERACSIRVSQRSGARLRAVSGFSCWDVLKNKNEFCSYSYTSFGSGEENSED